MNRSISILVAIVFFLFGAGALYVLASKGIIVVNPNVTASPTAVVVAQPTPSASPVVSPAPSAAPSVVPTPTPAAKPKTTIEGTLGYPSEGIPPLIVYAFNSIDSSKNAFITTAQNVSSFSIVVEPGKYSIVAYTKDGSLAGGYTKAVPCGLSVECKDHSLIMVNVEAGKTVSNVEVKDWYAPAGTFPPKP